MKPEQFTEVFREHFTSQGRFFYQEYFQQPGIAEADRARVMERFVRGTDRGNGCGLGLAIVREIIERHGGSVHLGDAPPHGLCVTLTLPLSLSAGHA